MFMVNFNHNFLTNMFRPKHIVEKIVILLVIYILFLDVSLRCLEKLFFTRETTLLYGLTANF
jgi:hypothetical protein